MSVLCKNVLAGIRFVVNFGIPPDTMPPQIPPDINPNITLSGDHEPIIVRSKTCTKYMTSVHPSREITRKMATQARPMLSKEMAPLNGLVGPVVHFV